MEIVQIVSCVIVFSLNVEMLFLFVLSLVSNETKRNQHEWSSMATLAPCPSRLARGLPTSHVAECGEWCECGRGRLTQSRVCGKWIRGPKYLTRAPKCGRLMPCDLMNAAFCSMPYYDLQRVGKIVFNDSKVLQTVTACEYYQSMSKFPTK